VHSCLLSHRILEILTSIGAPVSWYCERFTSIHGQCFAKSSALGMLQQFECKAWNCLIDYLIKLPALPRDD
jgi:hypothetical protein